jgi:hypothetical protein
MIQIKDDGGSIGSFIAKNVRCEFSNMLVAA